MDRAKEAPRVIPVLAALARGALGDGYIVEVADRMLDGIGEIASESECKQLLGALNAMNTRAGALLLTGRPVPVSWLSPSGAEALLIRWKSSRISMQRQLASGILSLALSSLYGRPGPEWDRIGYQGPMGPAPVEPKRLSPRSVDNDEVLHCDVVIVGSGAGGGCVAGVLAASGLDVVVLEKGGYKSESDFDHLEAEASRDMYLYGMKLLNTTGNVRIIAGATLGGGTVVNYTTSFKTPDFVLDEWTRITGIEAFASGEFEASLDEVSARLNVNLDSSAAGKRDELMESGLKKLGWHVDLLPRAVKGCTQDEQCGYCGFGCRPGAKQSTMRTYLEDAAAGGARIITGADVRTVRIVDGRATGVDAVVGPHRLTVTAKKVVVAAGSIESPALLLRSGLGGRVGHNLHLHPGTAAFGIFEDDVKMWEGTLQSRYSSEFRHWDGGYGPIFETVPVHPGAGSTFIAWEGAAHHRLKMEAYKNKSFCAVLPRDTTNGRVRIGKDGSPRVEYKLNADDERRIAEGVVRAGQVMEAAGATEVESPHGSPIIYHPGTPGAHEAWAAATRARGYSGGRATLASFHQMGSCRMGTDPSASAIGPYNESHEVSGLFVTDGSAFPTASGVNPMLTIYGIANRAAKHIAERLA
ncbi:MAG: oxidoreductase [Actinobacteria bacterium]|jgi:choline dehydrogenase-like flavoprotein|nr:oxidoreductase [Actinomycetota bacterium]